MSDCICPECNSAHLVQQTDERYFRCSDCGRLFKLEEVK